MGRELDIIECYLSRAFKNQSRMTGEWEDHSEWERSVGKGSKAERQTR